MTRKYDRRRFVKVAGAAALGAGSSLKATGGLAADVVGAAAGPADLIFKGGTIVTMVDGSPEIQAVAVAGGSILAAGSEADIMALASDATKIIDLKGATLMPSFIDAHGHFMNAPQVVTWANVSGVPVGPVTDIPSIVEVLKAHVKRFDIKPGEWVVGYGYDGTTLAEGRELSRDDLDPHFPDHLVMLMHVSNHGCVMNSKAFEWAKSMPRPNAGRRRHPAQGGLKRARWPHHGAGLCAGVCELAEADGSAIARHSGCSTADLRQRRRDDMPGRRHACSRSRLSQEGR